MNERPCGENTVQNVGCRVKECLYHNRADMCTAHKIEVSNENARRKAETFCATFENKASF
ncbi:MAG: DUF1540 domain-containing protein [Oscillospiraceae bacterium]|nr:DUF1540 domain-containing protein [Oscillospiraceae bacterium]